MEWKNLLRDQIEKAYASSLRLMDMADGDKLNWKPVTIG